MRPPPEPPPARLLTLLQHPDREIACIAANALACSGDARLIPLLADFLQSPPPDKRASGRGYAAWALLRLGNAGWEVAAKLVPECLSALWGSDDPRTHDILADYLAHMPEDEASPHSYYSAAQGLARTKAGCDSLIVLLRNTAATKRGKHHALTALVLRDHGNRKEMHPPSLAAPLIAFIEEQSRLDSEDSRRYPWDANCLVALLGMVEGNDARDWLLNAFLHGNNHSPGYFGRVIGGLAKHKTAAAVGRLCQLLSDGDLWFIEEYPTDDSVRYRLRWSAAYALGEIGDRRAIPFLRARYDATREQTLFPDDPPDSDAVELCVVCANALARLGDATALARLAPFVGAPIDEYHNGVSPVTGFVTLGDAAVDFLVETTESDTEIGMANAVEALSKIASERTVPVLRRLLEHSKADIRGLAVAGLRKAGDRASAGRIAALLEPTGNQTEWRLYLPILHALKAFADPATAGAVAAAIPNRRGILFGGCAVEALEAFGSAAFPPVRALLAADTPRTRADAALTLAHLGDGDALPLLRVGEMGETDPLAKAAFEVAGAYFEVRAGRGADYVAFC